VRWSRDCDPNLVRREAEHLEELFDYWVPMERNLYGSCDLVDGRQTLDVLLSYLHPKLRGHGSWLDTRLQIGLDWLT